MFEWNGSLRWLKNTVDCDHQAIRQAAEKYGGHATLFRHPLTNASVFHPLSSGLVKIHRALKEQFDPAGIFNPGRLYPEL